MYEIMGKQWGCYLARVRFAPLVAVSVINFSIFLIFFCRRYASSNALKGDFTRTGIRSWRGALSDGSSSLTRLLANATQDFFRQAGNMSTPLTLN
jgi:hypothetical protein